MAKDRKGIKLHLGDIVHLAKGMRLGRQYKAMVTRIDGEYITCNMYGPGYIGDVERYGCELTIVKSFWSNI